VLGTAVDSRAAEITFEIAMNDSVDSFPPMKVLDMTIQVSNQIIPFKIAALPDLIARDAMLAMTSGRASKMIKSTPIGQDTRSRSSPSSSFVRSVTFPTSHFPN
jgi:hypothetical protein